MIQVAKAVINRTPKLTARAFAEFMLSPVHKQMPHLWQHKYPKSNPAFFKTGYYHAVREFIRRHFSNPTVISELRPELFFTNNDSCRENNIRAHDDFLNSRLCGLNCVPLPIKTYKIKIGELVLRITPDVEFSDNGTTKYILIDYTNKKLTQHDVDVMDTTLEIAWEIIRQNNADVGIADIRYFKLQGDVARKRTKVRKRTMASLDLTAKAITSIWPNL
jgi:hypothetical protein